MQSFIKNESMALSRVGVCVGPEKDLIVTYHEKKMLPLLLVCVCSP